MKCNYLKMNSILVFDNLNDVIYANYNLEFSEQLHAVGISQCLISSKENVDDNVANDGSLNTNILIQLFSPLVTSQRIMLTQFGNSYTSIQCENGVKVVFDEYMGFLFLCFGCESIPSLQHNLSVFISLVKHVCGPDVTELKKSTKCQSLLDRLYDSWYHLHSNDQSYLVEALEQLSVSPDVTNAAINVLRDSCNALRLLRSSFDCSRSHALIFVENKLLALYTSREADDLSPSDIMFLSILGCSYFQKSVSSSSPNSSSPIASVNISDNLAEDDVTNSDIQMNSEITLLRGKKVFMPHAVHLSDFGNGVTFLLLYQVCNENLCIGFDETFSSLSNFNKLLGSETEIESQKKAFESIESGMKRVLDCLKKVKNKQEIEPFTKQLLLKWNQIKKKYNECIKNNEDLGLSLSACCTSLVSMLRQFYQSVCLACSSEFPVSHSSILNIFQLAKQSLFDFTDFLKVKSCYNFTLGSRAFLTINKYLEEFPGLVHFLYIDRSNHRVTAPFLHFSSEETNLLAKKKIWEMVELSRNHVRDGHVAFMWKDTTFNYAYYLWFEDISGTPLKPKINLANVIKTLPMPGILAGDFYKGLVEKCFPKVSNKVRCFELYCIHLGLATSSCVLDQSRRIAATIWEVTGQHANNTNLF